MIVRQHGYRVLVACLLLVLAAACGTAAPSGSTPTALAPASESRRSTTLFLWHAWPLDSQRVLATLVERYNRSHPATQVVPQVRPIASLTSELRSAALEGSGPHLVIIQSHTLGALAQDQLLLPLTDLVSPAERDTLLPAAVGGAQAPGPDGLPVLYGLPFTFDTLVLYYNRANVFAPPADTDALLRSAHGLTQPPFWGLAYTLSLDTTIGYLYAFGGRVFDDRGNLVLGGDGRAGTERWLEWLQSLRKDPQILASTDSITVERALKLNQVLMTIDWSSTLPTYRSLWGENLGVAPLPRLAAEDRAPQPYVQGDVIAMHARVTDPADQRAALDFMRYLLTEEAQRRLLAESKQPTLLSLKLDGDSPDLAAARLIRQQAEGGQPIPNSRLANEEVWVVLDQMLSSVLRGLVTPAEAVTRADAALRAQLGLPPPP